MGSVRVKISTSHNLVKTEVLSKIEKDSLLAESLYITREHFFHISCHNLVSQIVTIVIFEEKNRTWIHSLICFYWCHFLCVAQSQVHKYEGEEEEERSNSINSQRLARHCGLCLTETGRAAQGRRASLFFLRRKRRQGLCLSTCTLPNA